LPLHIRCSARSESWLSPAYGQAVCWIEFWQYPPSDEFTERMQALLEPFHYRFHWGKASRSTPAYISRQYERWNDFVALRRASDPGGMFGNEYLNSYFGTVER
jgi:L-gulonolactone oxidase